MVKTVRLRLQNVMGMKGPCPGIHIEYNVVLIFDLITWIQKMKFLKFVFLGKVINELGRVKASKTCPPDVKIASISLALKLDIKWGHTTPMTW